MWIITILYQVLALAAIAHAQTDCPDEVVCVANPCDTERCPRFLNADCRPNTCHGSCTANFFRARSGRNVTNRCDVETCNERQCPPNRVCIEETVPAECPQGKPRCRQHINTRCVLPQTISNCSQLSCEIGDICVVQNEIARCTNPSSISRCRELDCDQFGFECQQFISILDPEREDLFICAFPVTCTPTRTAFCNERRLDCDEFNGLADCVATCETLQCERGGQECVMGINGRAICATPATCTPARVRICEQNGRVCEEGNGTSNCVVPPPTSPTNCDQIRCEPGSNCLEIPTANATTAVCLEGYGSTCEDLICTENMPCAQQEFPDRDFTIAACANIVLRPPIQTCSSNPCTTGQICVDLIQEGTAASFFCTPSGCSNGTSCDAGQECIVQPSLGPIGAAGVCVPETSRFDLEVDCSNRTDCGGRVGNSITPIICNTVDFQGRIVGTICNGEILITAANCDELNCAEGAECAATTVNERSLAACAESDIINQALEVLVRLH